MEDVRTFVALNVITFLCRLSLKFFFLVKTVSFDKEYDVSASLLRNKG